MLSTEPKVLMAMVMGLTSAHKKGKEGSKNPQDAVKQKPSKNRQSRLKIRKPKSYTA